jgi:hypothetical protein
MAVLEVLAEGFFWNLLEFGRRILHDVLHGWEMSSLESHFRSREQSKVTRSEIRTLRWLGDDTTSGCVVQCVIAMQKPLSLPATCHVASSVKLAHRNDQLHSVQAVRSHGAPNRRCQ